MSMLESLQAAKSCTDILNLLRAGGELVKYRYSFPYHFAISFGAHKVSFKPENGVIRMSLREDFYAQYTGSYAGEGRFKFDLDLDGWEELQKFVKGIKPAKRNTA